MKNEGSGSADSESRSYLEKKLVFCFGSHVASQMLLPFGEENFLSSSELTQSQEVDFSLLCAFQSVRSKNFLQDMQP